jgi:cell wall-associated NlpC family hydrolase
MTCNARTGEDGPVDALDRGEPHADGSTPGGGLVKAIACALSALCAACGAIVVQPDAAQARVGLGEVRDLAASHRAHERALRSCAADAATGPDARRRAQGALSHARLRRVALGGQVRAGRLVRARIGFTRSRERLRNDILRCRLASTVPVGLPRSVRSVRPMPAPQELGAAAADAPVGALAAQIIAYAEERLGAPYLFGANGPDRFDCSGLIWWVYRRAGVEFPRSSTYSDWASGIGPEWSRGSDQSALRAGDLVYLVLDERGPGHAGIYVGDGQMIHASSAGGRVIRSDITGGYYRTHFVGWLRHTSL